MRFFVALEVNGDIKNNADLWQSEHATDEIRWVSRENMHYTLIPPWESEDEAGLMDQISLCAGAVEPFDVELTEVSYGPNPETPRLVWASGETPQAMVDLATYVADALDQQLDDRPLKLHLTLGRLDSAIKPFASLPEKISWPQRVTSMVLMESILLSSGAQYRPIIRVSL